MRVAHLVPALFGPAGIVGGAERYALELARHMATEVPTTLITFGQRTGEETIGDLRVRIVGRPWLVRGQRTNPFSVKALHELLWAEVVHCHQQHVLISSAAAVWSRVTGRRVFVSDLGGGGWDVSAYVSTNRWFDGHLHLSLYSRQVYAQSGNPRARVIGGGVDIERFSPDSSVARDAGPLFVGRLLPHKGLADLLRAIPEGMSLRIVGPEPDSVNRTWLSELSRGKAVTFLHGLDDRALAREYQRALCIVLPSVYRTDDGYETRVPELLGQTLLEGMACGAPAICTDVASMPEIVENEVTGFVVPPNDPVRLGDRLAWLRSHPTEASMMGAAGRRRVLERFTWTSVVSRCLDAYRTASRSRNAASQRVLQGNDLSSRS